MSNLDKLKALVDNSKPSNWMENAQYRQENRKWLDHACNIALSILEALDEKKMTKPELAEKAKIDLTIINNMVKGHHAATIQELTKIEDVLEIKLFWTDDTKLIFSKDLNVE